MIKKSFSFFPSHFESVFAKHPTGKILRLAKSQIRGVVFACNYLGFNVLGVVMARYEVFFSRTNCRWSNVFHAIV